VATGATSRDLGAGGYKRAGDLGGGAGQSSVQAVQDHGDQSRGKHIFGRGLATQRLSNLVI